jgi:hypothetical protein
MRRRPRRWSTRPRRSPRARPPPRCRPPRPASAAGRAPRPLRTHRGAEGRCGRGGAGRLMWRQGRCRACAAVQARTPCAGHWTPSWCNKLARRTAVRAGGVLHRTASAAPVTMLLGGHSDCFSRKETELALRRTCQQPVHGGREVGVHAPAPAAEQLHRRVERGRRRALLLRLAPAAPPRLLVAERHAARGARSTWGKVPKPAAAGNAVPASVRHLFITVLQALPLMAFLHTPPGHCHWHCLLRNHPATVAGTLPVQTTYPPTHRRRLP